MGFFKKLWRGVKKVGRVVTAPLKVVSKAVVEPALKGINKGIHFVEKIPVLGTAVKLAETFTPEGELLTNALNVAEKIDKAVQDPFKAIKSYATPSGIASLAQSLGASKLPSEYVRNALKTSQTFQDGLEKAKVADKVLKARLGDPYRQVRQQVQTLGKDVLSGGSLQSAKQQAQQLTKDLISRAPSTVQNIAKDYARDRVKGVVSKLSQDLQKTPVGFANSDRINSAVSTLNGLLGT